LELRALEKRERRESHGERRGNLRESRAAKFLCHECGDDDDDGLCQHREETQAFHGKAEEAEA